MPGTLFYVAAKSPEPDGGIYRYEMRESAAPKQVGFNRLRKTRTISRFRRTANTFSAPAPSTGIGGVASFRLNPDGSLTPINSMSAEGKSTCYVIVDPSGNFLYAANYSSSSFVEFRLKEGRIVERTQLIRHEGSGPNPARQEAAHPHFTGITSDGRYLAVIDLGIDAIKCYPLDPEKGLDAAIP